MCVLCNIYKLGMRCWKITKKKAKSNQPLSERDILKMEIAKEMGIWEKVEEDGWQSLSNADCGRVGGIMKKRLQAQKLGNPVFPSTSEKPLIENNPV